MNRLDRFPSSQSHMFIVTFILGSQTLLYTVGSQYFRTSSLLCRFSHCVSWISQWLFSGGGGRKWPSGCFHNPIIFSHEITGCFCQSLSSAVSLCGWRALFYGYSLAAKFLRRILRTFSRFWDKIPHKFRYIASSKWNLTKFALNIRLLNLYSCNRKTNWFERLPATEPASS